MHRVEGETWTLWPNICFSLVLVERATYASLSISLARSLARPSCCPSRPSVHLGESFNWIFKKQLYSPWYLVFLSLSRSLSLSLYLSLSLFFLHIYEFVFIAFARARPHTDWSPRFSIFLFGFFLCFLERSCPCVLMCARWSGFRREIIIKFLRTFRRPGWIE